MKTQHTAGKFNALRENSPGSLNRAVTLLTAIARGSSSGSTLCQLVARTSLPRPTIHRILNTLISIGWVHRDTETSRFNIGVDLTALGFSAVARNPIEQIASPFLYTLAAEIKEVVYLNIRSGLDMVCIGRYTHKDQVHRDRGWVGMRGPLGMSPGCMGMFSRMPRDEVQEIIEANMSRYYRLEGFDERALRKSVELAIEDGYGHYLCILLDRSRKGLGMPICDLSGYPIAAIGITYIEGTVERDRLEKYKSTLMSVAGDIEQIINGRSCPAWLNL